MFDFFRDLFGSIHDLIFGEDEDITNFGGEEDVIFSPDDMEESDSHEYLEISERIIDDGGGGEYVQEFYDLSGVMDYLSGTPESVLKVVLDKDEEVYYVYRFPSD